MPLEPLGKHGLEPPVAARLSPLCQTCADMLLPRGGDAQNVRQVLGYSQTQAACPMEGQAAAGVR